MPKLPLRRRPPLPQASLRSIQVRRIAGLRIRKRSRARSALAKLNSFAIWDGWTKVFGLVAVVGIIFTQQSVAVSQKQVDLTEMGQISDRYTKAIEQLTSKELLVRVGAVHSLGDIAARWPDRRNAVKNVLVNFMTRSLLQAQVCDQIPSDVQQAAGVAVGDLTSRPSGGMALLFGRTLATHVRFDAASSTIQDFLIFNPTRFEDQRGAFMVLAPFRVSPCSGPSSFFGTVSAEDSGLPFITFQYMAGPSR